MWANNVRRDDARLYLTKGAVKLVAYGLFSLLLLVNAYIYPVSSGPNNPSSTIILEIWIYDVNTVNRTAAIEIKARVEAMNYEPDTTAITAMSGGSAYILCNKTYFGNSTVPSRFSGTASTRWNLWGTGEAYPFDKYTLNFEVQTSSEELLPFQISSESKIEFGKDEVQRDWVANGIIEGRILNIQLTRKWLVPFLQLLLPIIVCYYLLNATRILDVRKQLNERLMVYLSLFVFTPTFLFAIQPFLPYRLSLTLPEFLLTNLVVSNAVFGIFSMIGNTTAVSRDQKNRGDETKAMIEKWGFIASVLSLFIFLLLYGVTLFGKIDIISSLILYVIVIPSYVYFHIFKVLSRRKLSKQVVYVLFIYLILFLIPIILFLRQLFK